MSVYKEAVHAIATIENQSKRIYPDACDFGAPVKKGDDTWNWAKQLVDWFGVEGTRKEHRYATGATVSQKVSYMPNEHNSSSYVTVEVVFVLVEGQRNMDGYIYIQK